MPPHLHYAEPFAGGAGIFRRKPPALKSYLVEIDLDVFHWLQNLAGGGVKVERADAISWIDEMFEQFDEQWLLYVDPPYLPATRVKKKIYRHELDDDGHARLVRALLRVAETGAQIMVSGYASPLYDKMLAGWHVETLPAITRGGTMRDEMLWCNFVPQDASPLTPMVAGKNFRERERIKRKRRRWRRNFEGLASHERRAILADLLQAEQSLEVGDAGGIAAGGVAASAKKKRAK
jgi:hypothetical protein